MGFIPEDRLGMGLVGSMDIVDNLILKKYKSQPGIVIKKGRQWPPAQGPAHLVQPLLDVSEHAEGEDDPAAL